MPTTTGVGPGTGTGTGRRYREQSTHWLVWVVPEGWQFTPTLFLVRTVDDLRMDPM